MNNHILFSVIIPCYNRSKIIIFTLNSLSSQIYKNFEVIIVDDCSLDNLEEQISSYREKSNFIIRYIKNEKNMGVTYSRANGVKNSLGDWIVLLDSDDIFFPETLEMFKNEITNNPSIDYFGAVWTLSLDNKKRRHRDVITHSIDDYIEWLKTNPVDYQGCFNRKSLFVVPFMEIKAPIGEFFHKLEYAKKFSCKFIGTPQGMIGNYCHNSMDKLSHKMKKSIKLTKKLTQDEYKMYREFKLLYLNNKKLLKRSGFIHYAMWTRCLIRLSARNKNYIEVIYLIKSYYISRVINDIIFRNRDFLKICFLQIISFFNKALFRRNS